MQFNKTEKQQTAHIFQGGGRGREARIYRPVSLVSIPEKTLKKKNHLQNSKKEETRKKKKSKCQ